LFRLLPDHSAELKARQLSAELASILKNSKLRRPDFLI